MGRRTRSYIVARSFTPIRDAHSIPSQFRDLLPHLCRVRVVRVIPKKIFQYLGGRLLLATPKPDLSQEELRMRKVRGVDLPGTLQMLDRRIELPQLEVSHPELRGRQRVVRAREGRQRIYLERLIEFVHRHQHAAEID